MVIEFQTIADRVRVNIRMTRTLMEISADYWASVSEYDLNRVTDGTQKPHKIATVILKATKMLSPPQSSAFREKSIQSDGTLNRKVRVLTRGREGKASHSPSDLKQGRKPVSSYMIVLDLKTKKEAPMRDWDEVDSTTE